MSETPFATPESTSIGWELGGRVIVPVSLMVLLLAWAAGGVALLFAAFGLAVVGLAPCFAWRNLRRLRARVTAPGHHLVGANFVMEVELENGRRTGSARDLLFAPVEKAAARPRPAGFLPLLGPRRTVAISCAHRLLERGRQVELLLVVYSSYPFGLFRCSRRFRLSVDFLALPRLGSLADLGYLPSGTSETLAAQRMITHLEEEFYQLREWREGESLRRVHWKLSARRRRPILRDMKSRTEAPVHLVLLTQVRARRHGNGRRHRSFETAVSLAATLGEHFLRRGRTVRLSLAGAKTTVHPELRGRAGLFQLLVALAEVQVERVEAPLAPEDVLGDLPRGRESVIGVVAGDPSRRVEARRTSPEVRIIDVESAEIDAVFQRGRSWGAIPALSQMDRG